MARATALAALLATLACSPNLEDLRDGTSCGSGRKACLGACVEVDDPQYGCTTSTCSACSFFHARATCREGACAVAICDASYAHCEGSADAGCETNIDTNIDHCGGCNTVCPRPSQPNRVALCVRGVCEIACVAGSGDCDGDQGNGCETDLVRNPEHCGSCANACGNGRSCTASRCDG